MHVTTNPVQQILSWVSLVIITLIKQVAWLSLSSQCGSFGSLSRALSSANFLIVRVPRRSAILTSSCRAADHTLAAERPFGNIWEQNLPIWFRNTKFLQTIYLYQMLILFHQSDEHPFLSWSMELKYLGKIMCNQPLSSLFRIPSPF